LETGRTHQIRVHFASIRHPVVGDVAYGRRGEQPAPRLFLHATRLGFEHPITGERIEVVSALPEELGRVLDELGTPDVGEPPV
jgi:23S rRNA pseudouridine1911/1915/1917 synthase